MAPSLTQTKICGSCKRNLYIGSFGAFRKSKDGLNSTCRECRNFKRRCSYHGANSNEQFIYPLNLHNLLVLNEINPQHSKTIVYGLSQRDGSQVVIQVIHEQNCWTIVINENDRQWLISGACLAFLKDTVLPFFTKKGIRLF